MGQGAVDNTMMREEGEELRWAGWQRKRGGEGEMEPEAAAATRATDAAQHDAAGAGCAKRA